MKKIIMLIAVMAFTLTSLFAEGQKEQQGSDSEYSIGFVAWTFASEFYNMVTAGVKDAAEDLGVDVLILDGKSDAPTNANLIEDLIIRKVDAIVLAPADPFGAGPLLQEAEDEGIICFTEGSSVEGFPFIGIDNYKAATLAGEYAGDYVNENFGGEARVIMMTYDTELICQDRARGFMDGLKSKTSNVTLLARQDSLATREDAMKVFEDLYQAHSGVNVVFGINDDCALGPLLVLEDAGLTDKDAIIVGFDGTSDGIRAVQKDGIFKGSVDQDPYGIGRLSVETALRAVKGEEYETESPAGFISMDNLDDYLSRLE